MTTEMCDAVLFVCVEDQLGVTLTSVNGVHSSSVLLRNHIPFESRVCRRQNSDEGRTSLLPADESH